MYYLAIRNMLFKLDTRKVEYFIGIKVQILMKFTFNNPKVHFT